MLATGAKEGKILNLVRPFREGSFVSYFCTNPRNGVISCDVLRLLVIASSTGSVEVGGSIPPSSTKQTTLSRKRGGFLFVG